MLNLNAFSTFEIEKSPLRGNISYQFSQISKDKSLDTIFKTLIGELEDKGEKAERCIVFCQTRKQTLITDFLLQLLAKRTLFEVVQVMITVLYKCSMQVVLIQSKVVLLKK